MSNSWGHTIRPLTSDETEHLRQRDEARRAGGQTDSRYFEGKCRTGKCTGFVTHEVSYRYVTGRAGRVSDARRKVCDTHAEQFRAKYLGDGDPVR